MILDDDDDNADITEIYRLKILCKRGHEILKMRTVKLYILTLDHPPHPLDSLVICLTCVN